MARPDLYRYSLDAIQTLRVEMHRDGLVPLLSYLEWPHFEQEVWITSLLDHPEGMRLAVGHLDIKPSAMELIQFGVSIGPPRIRHWARQMGPQETSEAWAIMRALREGWPYAERGITLDGVHMTLLLQETEGLPPITYDWNVDQTDTCLHALMDWMAAIRLRKHRAR